MTSQFAWHIHNGISCRIAIWASHIAKEAKSTTCVLAVNKSTGLKMDHSHYFQGRWPQITKETHERPKRWRNIKKRVRHAPMPLNLELDPNLVKRHHEFKEMWTCMSILCASDICMPWCITPYLTKVVPLRSIRLRNRSTKGNIGTIIIFLM